MNLPGYTITDEMEIEAFQAVVDTANAANKITWDSKEASKPEKDRVEFTPKTVDEYWLDRVAEIVGSYKKQLVDKRGSELMRKINAKELSAEEEALVLDLGKEAAKEE